MENQTSESQSLYNQLQANNYIIKHLELLMVDMMAIARNNKKIINELININNDLEHKIQNLEKDGQYLIKYDY